MNKEQRKKHAAWVAEWRRKNPEKTKEIDRKCREKGRAEVLAHYSPGKVCCACCGEDTVEFLGIDHMNGGGTKQRKELGWGGHHFYRWLRRNGWPTGYQVLCHNCNQAKGMYGKCPHQK